MLASVGSYLFSAWDSHRYQWFGRISHGLLARFFPDNPPQFQAIPFSYGFDATRDSLVARQPLQTITAHVVALEKEYLRRHRARPQPHLRLANRLPDQGERKASRPSNSTTRIVAEFQRELGNPGKMPIQATVLFGLEAGLTR